MGCNRLYRGTCRWQEQARLLGLRPTTEGYEVIRNGLADRWKDTFVASIDGRDIHELIDEVRHIGAPGLQRRSDKSTEARARAMFACLSKMFSWLGQQRKVEKNPCASVTDRKRLWRVTEFWRTEK
jgi:hypothetical protein